MQLTRRMIRAVRFSIKSNPQPFQANHWASSIVLHKSKLAIMLASLSKGSVKKQKENIQMVRIQQILQVRMFYIPRYTKLFVNID